MLLDLPANLGVSTNGQNLGVLNLALLDSGVGSTGGLGAGTGPSVGGQRPRNNNFTVEGIDNNNKGITGPLIYIPQDAVANFSILQNQFNSEFGHSSGGQFSLAIESGTNSFHGKLTKFPEPQSERGRPVARKPGNLTIRVSTATVSADNLVAQSSRTSCSSLPTTNTTR